MMRDDTKRVFIALSKIPDVGKFTLVGGTAIAIKANHRLSEDLDFCVTDKKLDRAAINAITKALAKDFKLVDNTDITQQESFENDGLDLLDHHQDWLVDNVKLTFFTAGASDEERNLLSALPVEKLENINVMSLEGLFVTKCLALADRIKTRDIFDLWWFIKNDNHTISEIFTVIQDARPHITYESIRYRLLDWDIPLTDEGLESVVPIAFEKVRGELRDMVNSLEVEMAKRIAKTFRK